MLSARGKRVAHTEGRRRERAAGWSWPREPVGTAPRLPVSAMPFGESRLRSGLRKPIRLLGAQGKVNTAASLALPDWRSLRERPVSFVQPKPRLAAC